MKIKTTFLIIISLAFFSCRNRQPLTRAEELPRVRVSQVTRQELSMPVHSTGILALSEETKLSFKTGGIISSINVKEGQRVKKGAVLASLNPAEINAAVNQARNGYEKALRDFNRAENLYADSVATLEMRQNAATALDVAKSTLEVARFNLEHSNITAPDNGIILKQLARQNELISAGYPVFLFGSSGKYWKVRSGISDKDVVKINPGDSAVITFDTYPAMKFRAVVDEVGEMASQYTGTYETELILKDEGYRLASGFIAAVDIFPSEKKSFTMVPAGSIIGADIHQGYIYALTDSSTVVKLKVQIESIPGEMAAVSGIPEGITSIVSEGAAYLRNGMKVKVVK
jgi:RND family efflux transporter MFP subunit